MPISLISLKRLIIDLTRHMIRLQFSIKNNNNKKKLSPRKIK